MTSLLDIRPQTIPVPIGDVTIDCNGINADGVCGLMGRFPGLRGLIFPDGQRQGAEDLSDPLALVQAAPETIAAIIAAGTGHPGDAEHEAAARALPIDHQLDLLTAILRLTLPGGLVPFVEKITAVFGGVAENLQAPPNSAGPLPNGSLSETREMDTQSQLASNG